MNVEDARHIVSLYESVSCDKDNEINRILREVLVAAAKGNRELYSRVITSRWNEVYRKKEKIAFREESEKIAQDLKSLGFDCQLLWQVGTDESTDRWDTYYTIYQNIKLKW